MTRHQIRRISLLLVVALFLAFGGELFAQNLGSQLLGGGSSGSLSSQILNDLRGSGSGGLGGVTIPQTTVPQQPSISPSGQATTPSQQAQTTASSTQRQQLAPSPPSSVELMFSSRLPEGSAALTQFGYDFFQRQTVSPFTSVGQNYVVGPGDVLAVYLWGDSVEVSGLQSFYQVQVDPNGTAFFAPVGAFPASGLNLSTIRNYLKAALSKQYKKFDIAVTLAKMREFPVYVSGFVNSPGPVMATAVDSVFNVIARAGGITKTGSLRKIVLNSADGTSRTIDLYNVLIHGRSTDIQVREGDSIFVPHIGPVAAIAGAVKRPGIYELVGERTVGDLISLAGGLLPSANLSAVTLLRFRGDQRTLIDGSSKGDNVESLSLEDGDLVSVNAVRDYVRNEVKIEGEVMYPGSYSVERVGTLKRFLELAKLLPDTDLFYGRLYRKAPGGVQENMTFSPKEVLEGKGNITLEARDRVVLYPFGENLSDVNFDNFPNTVTLEGDVRYPGMYAWTPGMKLSDIFGKRNFLVDTNAQYAIVVRQEIGSNRGQILTFSPSAIAGGKSDVTLKPLDRVQFVAKTIYDPIEVSGEVKQSQIVQYYDGINLIDLLRMVTLDGNPSDMKAYIYPAPTEASTLTPQQGAAPSGSAAPTTQQGTSASGGIAATAPGGQQGSSGVTGVTPAQGATTSGQGGLNPSGVGGLLLGPGVAPPIGTVAPAAAASTAGQTVASQQTAPQNSQPPASTRASQPTAGTGQGAQAMSTAPAQTTGAGNTASSQEQSGVTGSQSTQGETQLTPTPTEIQPTTPTVVYLDDLLRHQATQHVLLTPGEKVVFARVGPNEKAPQVVVRGEVMHPGAFLVKPGMRLSDVLQEAGGYTPEAYPEGLVLLRKSTAAFQRQELERAAQELEFALQQNAQGSAAAAITAGTNASAVQYQIQAQQAQLAALRSQISSVLGRISIHMPKTIAELAKSNDDIAVENGDTIFVPRTPNFVQIIGDVFNPVTVAFQPGLKVKDYLAMAGGLSNTADMRNSYAILADGTVMSAQQKPRLLFVRRTIENDPVTPGETIVVAQKPIKPNIVLPIVSQVASIVGSIASTALNVMAILKL